MDLNINKKAVAINTIFFILMSIMFIGILYFAYDKIILTKDIISEQDLQLLQNDVEDALLYCDDPLNRGSSRSVDLSSSKFNVICLLDEDITSQFGSDIGLIYEAGDNVVLLESIFYDDDNRFNNEYNVIASFNIDLRRNVRGQCWRQDNSGELNMDLIC